MKNNSNNIRSSLSKNDFLDLIKIHVTIKKEGAFFSGHCPFCNDKTDKNFLVYEHKKTWHCYSCRQTGNAYDFIQKIENISLQNSIKFVKAFINEDVSTRNTHPIKNKEKNFIEPLNLTNIQVSELDISEFITPKTTHTETLDPTIITSEQPTIDSLNEQKDSALLKETKQVILNRSILKKIKINLQNCLTPLHTIDGYLSSVIIDLSGTLLAEDNNSSYNLAFITTNVLSQVYCPNNTGLGKCNFFQVNFKNAIFSAVWAIKGQSIVALLVEPNANLGMAKIMLGKVCKLVRNEQSKQSISSS